jgi:hypothetical protein
LLTIKSEEIYPQKGFMRLTVVVRVARWYISIPKFAVLVCFERPWYGKFSKEFLSKKKMFIL